MIPVRRLNHAVLYVRDADRAAAFYQEAFGFEVVQRIGNRGVTGLEIGRIDARNAAAAGGDGTGIAHGGAAVAHVPRAFDL